ncbi:SNF2-related protein [Neomicrococcus lactis]|uniref:Superfamily II DNA or RNA helicase n=1 Tax=Neomicrococcus lactis TaxID=732241 RepID=A0A7W8YBV7_9MICC|nr:superfamily II DNA or RNA helicase [Neomicrococcus lactis]
MSYPLVDARKILKVVGGPAFARGKQYSMEHRIQELNFTDNYLQATVQGSEPSPYRSTVKLSGAPEDLDISATSCSCAVGLDCKHVAAVLIESNSRHLRDRDQFQLVQSREAPSWQEGFERMLGITSQGAAARVVDKDEVQPLALQFELVDSQAVNYSGWMPRSAGQPSRSRYRLAVRPMVKNSAGKWVRSNLRWNTISFKTYGLTLDEEQHRWFCQFVPLYRANGQLYFGNDNDWIFLDEFSSPLFWPLLREAEDLGIELITSTKDIDVEVGPTARVEVGISKDNDGAGLRLAPTLHFEGVDEPLVLSDERAVGGIGNFGIYFEDPANHRIVLSPVTGRLNASELSIVRQPESLRIPEEAAQEFLSAGYPRMRRRIRVQKLDESIELPEIVPPVFVTGVTFFGNDDVALDWWFEYNGVAATKMPDDLRDPDVEASLKERVRALLQNSPAVLASFESLVPKNLEGLDTVDFVRRVLPQLEHFEGVRVDVKGVRPKYRELTESPELAVNVVETERRDWFDLGLMIMLGEREIPLADILRALSRGQTRLLMSDKTYFSLEHPLFDKLKELVSEAQSLQDKPHELKITRYQASLWDEFDELATKSESPDSWNAHVSGLLSLAEKSEISVPSNLQAELRPYQREGFNWLASLWDGGLGGILADDMGLGKTIQALALILHAKASMTDKKLPFLVVAPTSVVPNWEAEALRFAPDLKVATISDTRAKSKESIAEIAAANDVVVTSYTLFRLDAPSYQAVEWGILMLDEAQFVKNKATKAHHAARDLDARMKLAITGTPMENNLMELWALLALTSPGLFPSAVKFNEQYSRPISNSGDQRTLNRLRKRVRPFMLRRTKEAVVSDLPPKQEQVLHVELAPKHRKLYDTHLQRERQKILRLVEDMDRNRFTIFQSLTVLRMMALDAALVDDTYEGVPSAKLDLLLDQLEEIVQDGHRALIFSQFTSFLRRAEDRLEAAGVEYAYLDGSTKNRAQVINSFKEGGAPVFLISLKAGGFGLNLTEADYVFLLDPWWNPAAEEQAVDRTHRIGQKRSVMVYRMVAQDTIEEKVVALQDAKRELISSVMDGGDGFASRLTADDIRRLLAE